MSKLTTPCLSRARLPLFAALALAIAALPSRGDVIILKDGYAIHGKPITEQTTIDDKNGQFITVRKLNALNMMDDGPRLTVFSAHYKRVGDIDAYNKFGDHVKFTRVAWHKSYHAPPPDIQVESATPFNALWVRTLICRNILAPQNGPHKIEQQIDLITPHYVRMTSTTHSWLTFLLTKEIGSDAIRKLLSTHPDLAEKVGMPEGGKRAKLIRFLLQADWWDEADEEVERLLADIPAEKERADALRKEIQQARLDQLVVDVERSKEAGQHDMVRKLLQAAPRDNLAANMALKFAQLRAEYDAGTLKLEKSHKAIDNLLKLVDDPRFGDLVAACAFIKDELHFDTATRLDLFNVLAEQAEQQRQKGKTPSYKSEELLAAAINGWLMGNSSTETSLPTARKRLKARTMALNYLREANPTKRNAILQNYIAETDALKFDELEMLISLLPPPEAERIRSNFALGRWLSGWLSTTALESQKSLSNSMLDRKTGPLPGAPTGVSYLLRLPPEYQHGRAYPLLIALPAANERPSEALRRLGDHPGKHGYIVAVVDWQVGFGNTYKYTDDEQLMITGVLRHLRRTLQVDSNRVFVFGEGEGANFALDLGANQPDLFAGVIPMNATPVNVYYTAYQYWKNFQNLPVYMVMGDRIGEAGKTVRVMLTGWMPGAYPCLAVSYKGRGLEYFQEELPYIFDWMGRKTRSAAFPDLGREEFRTTRTASNHFYWVTSEEIDPRYLFDISGKKRAGQPAVVQARFSEGNVITVNQLGFNQLSIWLGKGTVDFAKPVVLTIKEKNQVFKKELTPKISVLLEDLYTRGDRQRPYYQRIDCVDLKGVVKYSSP